MDHEFIDRIRATIERYRMLEPGDSVLVGVSGGPDSVALLHALYSLLDRFGISLTVAHFNHGLRGAESDRDEQFVRHMADGLGIPLVVGYGGKTLALEPGNLEEQARLKRYDFFRSAAHDRGLCRIAVGHTANDQAETVLLWLLRGTGKKGLGGIPPVRNDIIRPLIDTERLDILNFLKDRGIPWVDDSSNRETAFRRNRVRRRLIPLLEEEFEPQVVKLLASTAEVLRDEEAWLEQITGKHFETTAREVDTETVQFEIQALDALPKALQRRLVRQALHVVNGSLRKIGFDHVEAVRSLIWNSSPHAAVSLPDGLCAQREYGTMRIGRVRKECVSFCYSFDRLPTEVDISEIGRTITFNVSEWSSDKIVPRSAQTAVIDRDAVNFPLVIRSMKQGDRFYPLGTGGSKKIKDFFIDNKITIEKRFKIPLVVFDDEIAWVGEYRIDDRTKVTDRTRRVIRMVIS